MTNAEMNVILKANADQIQDALKKVGTTLDQLSKKIKELPDGSKELNKLTREFARTSESQKKLIDAFGKINQEAEGTQTTFKKTGDAVKSARNAMTSLSLIAQDLPYGFIGIQNNIPALIQNFGNLTASLKSQTIPSLKEFTTALAGPAAFFAFSAVTAALTYLAKEYGSVGAGIKALISNNAELAKSQNTFNKSLAEAQGATASETAKVNTMISVLNNLKAPLADRQAAYEWLKKNQPDIVAGVDRENISSQKSIQLINAQAQARKKLIELRAQEFAINKVITDNAVRQSTLDLERIQLLANQEAAQKRYDLAKKAGLLDYTSRRGALAQEEIQLISAKQALEANTKEYDALSKVQQTFLQKLDPIVQGISQIEFQTIKTTEAHKANKEALEKANKEYEKRMETIKGLAQEALYENDINTLRERALKIAEEYNKKLKEQKDLNNQLYGFRADFTESFKTVKGPDIKKVFPWLEESEKALKQYKDNLQKIAQQINQVFVDPLIQQFEKLLKEGTFNFKEFTQDIIINITRIAAKLATLKLVEQLSKAIPGVDVTTSGASGIADILKFLGTAVGSTLRPEANLSGVTGGNMGLTGSVNLVLRGADLVGSINRTNSQITRIG